LGCASTVDIFAKLDYVARISKHKDAVIAKKTQAVNNQKALLKAVDDRQLKLCEFVLRMMNGSHDVQEVPYWKEFCQTYVSAKSITSLLLPMASASLAISSEEEEAVLVKPLTSRVSVENVVVQDSISFDSPPLQHVDSFPSETSSTQGSSHVVTPSQKQSSIVASLKSISDSPQYTPSQSPARSPAQIHRVMENAPTQLQALASQQPEQKAVADGSKQQLDQEQQQTDSSSEVEAQTSTLSPTDDSAQPQVARRRSMPVLSASSRQSSKQRLLASPMQHASSSSTNPDTQLTRIASETSDGFTASSVTSDPAGNSKDGMNDGASETTSNPITSPPSVRSADSSKRIGRMLRRRSDHGLASGTNL
jgi:hypothetical protein